MLSMLVLRAKSGFANAGLDVGKNFTIINSSVAGVVELADTLDLGSSAERLGGSNPLARNSHVNDPRNQKIAALFVCPIYGVTLSSSTRQSSSSIRASRVAIRLSIVPCGVSSIQPPGKTDTSQTISVGTERVIS